MKRLLLCVLALFLAFPALRAQEWEHNIVETVAGKARDTIYIQTSSERSLSILGQRASKGVKLYIVIGPDLKNKEETKKLLRRGAQIWVDRVVMEYIVVADGEYSGHNGKIYRGSDKADKLLLEWRRSRNGSRKL